MCEADAPVTCNEEHDSMYISFMDAHPKAFDLQNFVGYTGHFQRRIRVRKPNETQTTTGFLGDTKVSMRLMFCV
jgi:hypothetical protein